MAQLKKLFILIFITSVLASFVFAITPQNSMNLRNFFNISNVNYVDSSYLCLSGDCISSWNTLGNSSWNESYARDIFALIGEGGNSSFNQGLTDTLYYPLSDNPSGYLTDFIESDPVWTSEKNNYYTKLETEGLGVSSANTADFWDLYDTPDSIDFTNLCLNGVCLTDWIDVNGSYTDQNARDAVNNSGYYNINVESSVDGASALSSINTHLINYSNPHQVTASQVGAVSLSGDETIYGIKTFDSFPKTPSNTPLESYDVANKYYVDQLITYALAWKQPVASKNLTTPPSVNVTGDRYIVNSTGATGAWTGYDNYIVQWNGTGWEYNMPQTGDALYVLNILKGYVFNGAEWVLISEPVIYTASNGVKLVGLDIQSNLKNNGGLNISNNQLYVSLNNSVLALINGNITITDNGVINSMLAGGISDDKLNVITTANKVNWSAVNKSGSSVNDLADVTITTPLVDDCLKYDGSQWVNSAECGSGSGGNASFNQSLTDFLYADKSEPVALSLGNWSLDKNDYYDIGELNYLISSLNYSQTNASTLQDFIKAGTGITISYVDDDPDYLSVGSSLGDFDTTYARLDGTNTPFVGAIGFDSFIDLGIISTPSTPGGGIRVYAKNNGSEDRLYFMSSSGLEQEVGSGGGGGGATTLFSLTDVDDDVEFTNNYVLVGDDSEWTSRLLSHNDILDIGSYNHSDIDAHISSGANPHGVTAAQIGAVNLTGDETVYGVKTFNSFPVVPSGNPTIDSQVTNKFYVDQLFSLSLSWKQPIRSINLTSPPVTCDAGHNTWRYVVNETGASGAWSSYENNITECNGSSWVFTSPETGWALLNLEENKGYVWNGEEWLVFNQPVTYTANNGLTLDGNQIKLGGSLSEDTTINVGDYLFNLNLDSNGDFRIKDSGTEVFEVSDSGLVGVGTLSLSGSQLYIKPTDNTIKGLVIRPYSSSQTGNLFEVQTSTGTAVSYIDATGRFYINKAYNGSSANIYAAQNANILKQQTSATSDETWDNAYESFRINFTEDTTTSFLRTRFRRDGTFTNPTVYVTVYVYDDNAGQPGSLLYTGGRFYPNALGTSTTSYAYNTLAYTFTAGVNYWVVFKQSAAPTGANLIYRTRTTAGSIAEGADGVSWSVKTGEPYYNFYSTSYYSIQSYSDAGYAISANSITNTGVYSTSTVGTGVYGVSSQGYGVRGNSAYSYGGYFSSTYGSAIYGTSSQGYGLYGVTTSGTGIYGTSTSGTGLSATTDTGRAAIFSSNNAVNNSVQPLVRYQRTTSGVASPGIGSRVEYYLERASGSNTLAAYMDTIFTDVTTNNEKVTQSYYLRNNTVNGEIMRLVTNDSFTGADFPYNVNSKILCVGMDCISSWSEVSGSGGNASWNESKADSLYLSNDYGQYLLGNDTYNETYADFNLFGMTIPVKECSSDIGFGCGVKSKSVTIGTDEEEPTLILVDKNGMNFTIIARDPETGKVNLVNMYNDSEDLIPDNTMNFRFYNNVEFAQNIIVEQSINTTQLCINGDCITEWTSSDNTSWNESYANMIYVPYTGATQNVRLNEKNLTNFTNIQSQTSNAIGQYSNAIGYQTQANGNYSTATGYYTQANGEYSTATGYYTQANGQYSTATGYATQANGTASTAMGTWTQANGTASTATGYYTQANGQASTAMGSYTQANGETSTAMGDYTQANGQASTATGVSTQANGTASTAMGTGTQANGTTSTAMGTGTQANGQYSTTTGYYTQANGQASTATGWQTQANGTTSTAMGYNTTANATNSVAMGQNIVVNTANQLGIGGTINATGYIYSSEGFCYNNGTCITGTGSGDNTSWNESLADDLYLPKDYGLYVLGNDTYNETYADFNLFGMTIPVKECSSGTGFGCGVKSKSVTIGTDEEEPTLILVDKNGMNFTIIARDPETGKVTLVNMYNNGEYLLPDDGLNFWFYNNAEFVQNINVSQTAYANAFCFQNGTCLGEGGVAGGNSSFNQSLTDSLYLGINDQKYNDTEMIISVNESWKANNTHILNKVNSIGNWSADKNSYYNLTQVNSIINSIGNFTAWNKDYNDLINKPSIINDNTSWNESKANSLYFPLNGNESGNIIVGNLTVLNYLNATISNQIVNGSIEPALNDVFHIGNESYGYTYAYIDLLYGSWNGSVNYVPYNDATDDLNLGQNALSANVLISKTSGENEGELNPAIIVLENSDDEENKSLLQIYNPEDNIFVIASLTNLDFEQLDYNLNYQLIGGELSLLNNDDSALICVNGDCVNKFSNLSNSSWNEDYARSIFTTNESSLAYVNSSGYVKDWNASGLIQNWSNIISSTGDNSSWNEAYARGIFTTNASALDYVNTSGYVKDWNASGMILDWNSSGYIRNQTVGLVQDNSSWNEAYANSLYVPYTGATQNVNLNNKEFTNFNILQSATSNASGTYSTSLGFLTKANGTRSTSMGSLTIASGEYSTAIGAETQANGDYSTSMGAETQANGYASTSMGSNTQANGNYSVAMGENMIVNANHQLGIGGTINATGTIYSSTGFCYNNGLCLTGDNSSWNEAYARSVFTTNSSALAYVNASGYVKDWNASGLILNWNSSGYIRNQTIGIISDNTSWSQSAANSLYLGITDQRYNESGRVNTLNTSKALGGVVTCGVGTAIQNLTLNNLTGPTVQCLAVGSGSGTSDGTGGWTNTSLQTTTILKVGINTTTPTHALNVKGDVNITQELIIGSGKITWNETQNALIFSIN